MVAPSDNNTSSSSVSSETTGARQPKRARIEHTESDLIFDHFGQEIAQKSRELGIPREILESKPVLDKLMEAIKIIHAGCSPEKIEVWDPS